MNGISCSEGVLEVLRMGFNDQSKRDAGSMRNIIVSLKKQLLVILIHVLATVAAVANLL